MTNEHGEVAPRLSVVIAAFDAAETLGRQLAALRKQRPASSWEVLVCDNGSSDGTSAVVRRAAVEMPELRLVDASRRRGPSAARNCGVQEARAEKVAFCDADDVVAPGWVAAMERAANRADVVVGRLDHVTLNSGARVRTSWQQQTDGPLVLDIVPRYPCGGAGCLCVRRDAFLAVGGFCEDLLCGEDVDLCWRIQLAGGSLAFAPGAVVQVGHRETLLDVYRQMAGWASGDITLRRRYGMLRRAGLTTVDEVNAAAIGGSIDKGAPEDPRSVWRRRLNRVGRLRTSQGWADAAARLGHEVGRRRAARSRSVPVLSERDVQQWREAFDGAPRPRSFEP